MRPAVSGIRTDRNAIQEQQEAEDDDRDDRLEQLVPRYARRSM